MVKAILLAAGQGTRLQPYTIDRPKAMVMLAGVPMIERQCRVLDRAGVTDRVIVAGYRADRISPALGRIIVNPAFAATNMVASLMAARDEMDGKDDILVGYADIVYEPRVLASVLETPGDIAVAVDRQWRRYWALRMEDPLRDAETMRLDGGRIRELGRKPHSYDDIQGQYIGLFRIRAAQIPRLLAFHDGMDRQARYDGKDIANMYATSFLQALIDAGWDVRAAPIDNGWL
jgi:L-glutamine-phosphate cytidylyltransferase